ncbi:beta-aspartyl-peptidase [Proteinivorax hydrogeniformans]|uniref:Isoaspartyl dipeptidase n=1 Tax=Proteinivorax hydrogeniformans TaxID=1826727 RepID=A0AAU8HQV1_9FIRM
MITLVKGGEVYSPEKLGQKDILTVGGKVACIKDEISLGEIENNELVEVIDARGKYVFPGFIDGHVHITGGGGEGGFATRTPEIQLTDITTAGITTVIGCLGTDGFTRNMTDLLAKARVLNEEGITAYILSGSYKIPVVTLTGEVEKDIILIPEVLGVGEIALSDHRSFEPSISELKKLVAEVRVSAMLSGKKGAVNVHLGDGRKMFEDIWKVINETEIPPSHFIATHGNRKEEVFNEGLKFMKHGGFLDLTTSTIKKFLESGEVKCSRALRLIHEQNIPFDNLTLSSDGQGSLPNFSESGEYLGLKVGGVKSLYQEVKEAILKEDVPIEKAISTITKNPAVAYGLKDKGELSKGKDADITIVDKPTCEIETVISKGKTLVKEKEILVKGTFE